MPTGEIDAAALRRTYETAVEHQQAGRFGEAEPLYRQILDLVPDHPGCLHNLGLIRSRTGDFSGAAALFARAIATGRVRPEFHGNLGLALRGLGRNRDAAAQFERAIALAPTEAEFHVNLALEHDALGDGGAAEAAARYAAALKPTYAAAHYTLGVILQKAGRWDEAVQALEAAIVLKPKFPEAHHVLGMLYGEQRRIEDAVASFRQAVTLKPNFAEAYNGLGLALVMLDRLAEAMDAFAHAIAARPGFTAAHSNLAVTHRDMGDADRAAADLDALLAWAPEDAEAQCKKALLDLLRGDYAAGFARLERWRPYTAMAARKFPQPVWDGGDFSGKTLLLHDMQGAGDMLQFIRYAPMVKARGGAVIAGVQPELADLVSHMPGVDRVLLRGAALPPFDLHIPLMSLPHVFGTTLTTIPGDVPYVAPRAEDVRRWRVRRGDMPGLSVGLAWHGNPKQINDLRRSMPVADVASLCGIAGVRWVCLQGDATPEELAVLAGRGAVESYGPLRDWSETAALVATLDLVIAVDTGIAHLAGAMGKPVWTMLSFSADWRYHLNRDDNPWYPSMRLFRQRAPGDWQGVVAQVRQALAGCRV